ncbi:MAG TPA: Uxx-star family glutaredoxin-like (seleno)protein [Dehalococcoidales bacterium]|nr:Uxx-star family glutaredoxin-like (seleno)protein [Dehalococcoidales bacterium]
MAMDVKIYTTPTCGYCHQAKRFMDDLGVKYTEYDVSRDRAAAGEMVQLTGQMGVPVIVVDGQVIIGFDRARLQALLAGGNGKRRISFGLKIADAGPKARPVGALVGAVAPGSLGEKAGLKAGDIVTDINTRRVSNAAEMEKALAGLKPGGIMTVLFRRGDKPGKSEIVL